MPEVLNFFTFFRFFSVDHMLIQESNLNTSLSFRIPGYSALVSDGTNSRSSSLSPYDSHAGGCVIISV